METSIFTQPTDEEIEAAQNRLGFTFPQEYIAFIKSGYDLGDIPLEALEIHRPGSHVDIYEATQNARKYFNLPVELLPIVEDNSDYYCLNQNNEVVFWSHDGIADEKWANLSTWKKSMIEEFDVE